MRIARVSRMRMAASELIPDRKTVNTVRQLAIELRDAKKPLVVEKSPMMANATDASPTKGDKKGLSSAVFQVKNGKKAVLRLSKKPLNEKSGASSISLIKAGLIKADITKIKRPITTIRIVAISGNVGKVLMVKRR